MLWRYLFYVLKHKWYVLVECHRAGITWRGVTHDLSKFSPAEFLAYARKFHGDGGNKHEFDLAWLHHQRANDHHWQWWVDGAVVWEMSPGARREMLCDWRAMGRVFDSDAADYYTKNRDKIVLAPLTREVVERDLGLRE